MTRANVFVRGLSSETYGLSHFRREQLAAPRVRDDSVVVDTDDGAALLPVRQVPDLVAGGTG